MSSKTILLNWVYYHPVGHAVEAFKTAKGLWNANENVQIHLLLNSRTPVELAGACDWIDRAYAIDLEECVRDGENAACLRDVPTEWDFVVNDHRATCSPFQLSAPLRTFHDLAARRFQARLWKGGHHELSQAGAPAYQPNSTIRMRVPESAGAFVRTLKPAAVKIGVLLAGSSPEPIYPSLDWWRLAFSALQDELPDAHFFITGKSKADDRSNTMAFYGPAIADLTRASERIFNCYDIGIWNQLALLEWCDLLIAPHTGFAFLAPSVGTPWLAISGVRWPECYFNEVPFYCVLPECPQYPCWMEMRDVCRRRLAARENVPCMGEELAGRVGDLIYGTRLLLSDDFSFDRAEALHKMRIDQMKFAPERFFQIV